MWSSLKSDLSEFVSGVKEDGSNVLSTIDSKLENIERNLGTPNTDNDGGTIINDDGEVIDTGTGATPAAAREEAIRRMKQEETFLVPLELSEDDEDDEEYRVAVETYLSTFKIDDETQEKISALLEEHPDTLKKQFETIVPTEVSYEEFWKRCLFRCDPERISQEWELEEERAREARAKAISEGVASVKNLFGSAVTAVSKTLESSKATKADESNTAASPGSSYKYFPTQTPADASSSSAQWFGSNGRPPFVMNTAVDEDKDDKEEEEEEEEEEELGWDDDDEDFDDEEEEDEADEETEDDENNDSVEIDFSNTAETEQLKEQLAQIIEERDQLHETVEMQKKAMIEMQQEQQQQQPSSSDNDSKNAETIEKLKMDLFERNSELAALKASLEDTQDSGIEVQLSKANAKIAALERENENTRRELEEANTKSTKQASEIENLQAKIDETHGSNEQMTALEGEHEGTRRELEETNTKLTERDTEIERLKAEIDEAHIVFGQTSEKLQKLELDTEQLQSQSQADKAVMEQLRSQSQSDKESLFESQTANRELKTQLASIQEELAQANADAEAAAANSGDKSELENKLSELEKSLAEVSEEAKSSKAMVQSLTDELEEMKNNLKTTTERASELDKELKKAHEASKLQEDEFAARLEKEIERVRAESSPAGSHSTSSVVNVEAVPPVSDTSDDVPPTTSDDAEDEEDWGDDGWGDDDDL